MWSIIKDKDRAELLAKRFCPGIYQEFKSIKDFPTAIMLDEAEQMEKNLFWAIDNPALYYRISEDDDYIYAFYMVFHAFDWSDSKISWIRKWDSHIFDTESICFRWSKLYGRLDVATIYHHSIKSKFSTTSLVVYIQAEGHGIKPFDPNDPNDVKDKLGNSSKFVTYRPEDLKLEWIDKLSSTQYDRLKNILNNEGVNAPCQQAKNGWMFTAPNKLFNKL